MKIGIMQVLQWQEVVLPGKIQSIEMMSATEFMERYNSLTDIQLEFIHKIIGECEKSRSSQDLLARLVALNKEIHAQVPEIEQERLLNVIAVLYYGGQKIVYLEHQGLMLRTPYNNIKLSKVKTRGPEDGGNIGEWVSQNYSDSLDDCYW